MHKPGFEGVTLVLSCCMSKPQPDLPSYPPLASASTGPSLGLVPSSVPGPPPLSHHLLLSPLPSAVHPIL